ncbi:GspH/FimT family pseudopilin [Marinomonas algicola]|uniref:GspH/FimT family pseudopilin n=1 Tax=Marinomonas algicola TaxID=2773454 RepID=UPI00174DF1B3|nr:GspH/FimT family pseudopilin [Marinomonas algicola]
MTHEHGFSLVEVLIVLMIIAIISRTFPSSINLFAFQKKQNALYKTQQDLALWLIRARQLAVNINKEVILCGGDQCDGNWTKGLAIRSDNVTISTLSFDLGIHVSWKGFPVQKKSIIFLSDGLSSYQNGTFYLCHSGFYCYIRLNQSGRFYTSSILQDTNDGGGGHLC